MFSRFFIERPVLANVIAIVTMIVGAVALYRLPVEQFPDISPPTIRVSTVYPGANAQTVANTIASPIEQQLNGVENMLYMQSTSASDGSYTLTVTFDIGTNLDMAQVLVQNRVSSALPQLPSDVQRQGVTTRKQSTSIIMFVCLISPDGRYDNLFLSNYATIRLRDELSRIPGVGDILVIPNKDYSMRVWLDPERMMARNLTSQDVISALQEQNVQVAAGQIGQPPADSGQNFQYTVTTLGRLEDEAQFEEIVLKTAGDGSGRITRLKDVARIELGSKVYDQYFEVNGLPSAGLAIFQSPGANSLKVAEDVRDKMESLKSSFPEGMVHTVPYDTTKFVKESINEVYVTLLEAGILVLIVILVFLQDWRAVLIPATTVPVTIIGAFFAMSWLGFSINMLTLFGLVLAIGIVVDDAIVIVEGAAHNIDKRGMSAKDAAIHAMHELLGPIIGITLVLLAVFLPVAFLGGITGQLYRQFALTIAATALISAINAVTLKPVQCAQFLKKTPERRNVFFRAFNWVYDRGEALYVRCVQWVVRHVAVTMLAFVALLGFAGWLYQSLPTGFFPPEDQGYLICGAVLPDASSQERTREVADRINKVVMETPGIDGVITVGGQNLLDGTISPNAATFYVRLKPWEERPTPDLSQDAIVANLRMRLFDIQEAMVFAFVPPAVRGLGSTGGFQMMVQDREGIGMDAMDEALGDFTGAAGQVPEVAAVSNAFRPSVPQVYADIDRDKAMAMNVPLSSVFNAMQTYLGSAYVNDFNKFGRTYQVRVQGEGAFRADPEEIKRIRTRNRDGEMVPLGTLVNIEERSGPQVVTRYNLFTAATINGEASAGRSSGEALLRMEEVAARTLPSSMGYEWTGMAYQERKVGNEALWIYALAVLMVYLVLAGQYESWTSPMAVILVVPLGILGAAVAVALRGMDNNVYTQIGVVLIIALASKNAILIVEVARELRAGGTGLLEAAVEASQRRLRPILMTSFAFILGVYPLTAATGAGSASRRALGTAVFGGMLASTILAVVFVPAFFVMMQRLSEGYAKWRGHAPQAAREAAPASAD
ncbi:MAG: multidrug efflux RND transporter permease subunit [Planctomycetota bacterium]